MNITQTRNAEAPKILVVDDYPDVRTLVGEVLDCSGSYNIQYASDGAEALRALKAYSPDLLIIDVNLPDISGHEVVKQTQRDVDKTDMSIVMLSGEEASQNASNNKVDAYIQKPFCIVDLCNQVQTILDE